MDVADSVKAEFEAGLSVQRVTGSSGLGSHRGDDVEDRTVVILA